MNGHLSLDGGVTWHESENIRAIVSTDSGRFASWRVSIESSHTPSWDLLGTVVDFAVRWWGTAPLYDVAVFGDDASLTITGVEYAGRGLLTDMVSLDYGARLTLVGVGDNLYRRELDAALGDY